MPPIKYTQEHLYNIAGQYDKMVTVTFVPNSDSFKDYGNWITGVFLYYPEERLKLENQPSSVQHLPNRVRFSYLSYDLEREKVKKLEKIGIPLSDIRGILVSPYDQVNMFTTSERRKVNLTKIQIPMDFSGIDRVATVLHIYNQAFSSGFTQTPHEDEQFLAASLIEYSGSSMEKEMRELIAFDERLDPDNVQIHYLRFKKLRSGLTDDEKKELYKLYKQRDAERISILASEMKKANANVKAPAPVSEKYLQRLIDLVYQFEPETLLRNKIPVWWDFERFAHIFLRHVDILQLGSFKEDKTPFQYNPSDIKDLIKVILKQEAEEIETQLQSRNSYFRIQKRSVYYNGDYYEIVIEPSGKLMTFYKKKVFGT